MTANGILQIALFFVVLLALTKPLGAFMAKVFAGERTFLHPVLRPLAVEFHSGSGPWLAAADRCAPSAPLASTNSTAWPTVRILAASPSEIFKP